MKLPSIKTLATITDKPKELRKLLEIKTRDKLDALLETGQFPHTSTWLSQCYNRPSVHETKMAMADEILNTFGVEYISRGKNAKSPAIEYCNSGDTYNATLMFVNGNYVVGCWGDIVERGNYE